MILSRPAGDSLRSRIVRWGLLILDPSIDVDALPIPGYAQVIACALQE